MSNPQSDQRLGVSHVGSDIFRDHAAIPVVDLREPAIFNHSAAHQQQPKPSEHSVHMPS